MTIQEVLKEHTEEDLPTIEDERLLEKYSKRVRKGEKLSTANGVNGTGGLREETGKGCQSLA